MSNLALPPYSEESEDAVIGSILIDPDEALSTIQPIIRPSDFYIVRNRWVYEAILSLTKRGDALDLLTLDSELQRQGKAIEIGGMTRLAELINAVPTALNVETYARQVAEDGSRRRLLNSASEIARIAYARSIPSDELSARAESALESATLTESTSDILSPQDNAVQYQKLLQDRHESGKALMGHKSGYPELDNMLGGLRPGSLIVLAARPAMGKTTFAINITSRAVFTEKLSAAVFSLEMSRDEINDKIMADQSGIDYGRLQRGQLRDDEWSNAAKVSNWMFDARLFISDDARCTPSTIRNICKRIKAKHGLDLVVVDYLQLMSAEGFKSDDRVGAVGYISRQLKLLAKELSVPVLALSQLSRECERRTDKRPILSDLRDSGAVEQDADAVMSIYRDEVYNPDTDQKSIAEIGILKNRKGKIGKVNLFFDGRISSFANLAREKIELTPWGIEPINAHKN